MTRLRDPVSKETEGESEMIKILEVNCIADKH